MTKILYTKLDARNTGYGTWKYHINRPRGNPGSPMKLFDANQYFHAWRAWCWETWGPSKEISDWLEDRLSRSIPANQNQSWSWQHDKFATRLYLRGDEELSLFKLRWDGCNMYT